ncbi:MAG TPA: hypothetical protein VGP16_26280, partial [Asanoa sp.]|nr:hypothetical protein [Asanoa sp.]
MVTMLGAPMTNDAWETHTDAAHQVAQVAHVAHVAHERPGGPSRAPETGQGQSPKTNREPGKRSEGGAISGGSSGRAPGGPGTEL